MGKHIYSFQEYCLFNYTNKLGFIKYIYVSTSLLENFYFVYIYIYILKKSRPWRNEIVMESFREHSAASSVEANSETCTFPVQLQKKKKIKSKNTRRFSDEQIRLLETIFVSESTKLEPMKKLQLAKELGLQPRQVAIWFQNKRARWKSKQIEQDYATLKANYDCLASRFESLKKEKDSLLAEVILFKFTIKISEYIYEF